MRSVAGSEGVVLEAISGYRSHHYQLGIFERKLARGQTVEQILTVNAAPGYSEHHSGNALDIGTPGEAPAEESFEKTAAFAWLTAGPPVFPASARYWGGVAYLAILGSVVTFPLYFRLIRDLGPGRAAYNGVLVPVVAMALSTLLEGYRWSALAVFGAVLALAGMVVALRGRAAPPDTP